MWATPIFFSKNIVELFFLKQPTKQLLYGVFIYLFIRITPEATWKLVHSLFLRAMRSSKPGGPVVAARECDMGHQNAACSLVGFWAGLGWLVLVYCERKTLLAGWFGLAETNKRTDWWKKIHFPTFFPMKLITYSCVFLEYDLCFTGKRNQF